MGEVSSRDVRSVGKYVKGGVGVIIDYSEGWDVDRGFYSRVCRGVDGEINISKVESM